MDIIVTNQKVDKDGNILSINDFITAATSEEGLNIDGNLYVDTYDLDQNIYEAIIAAMPSAIFFTINGDIPDFIKSNVEDWESKKELEEPFIEKSSDIAIQPTNIVEDQYENFSTKNVEEDERISDLFEMMNSKEEENQSNNVSSKKEGKVYLFGSSKGGTGKTFTCLISAYRYAKMHPNQKVAVSDFDIIDGQVGISIHKVAPTMFNYYKQWQLGNRDFKTMEEYKVKNDNFPSNLDFYLAPRDLFINNNQFWFNIFTNLIQNYDAVFFDSGIDYMHYTPISTLYKIADKIILVSTTSIKSVSSVTKQISRLKGEDNTNNKCPFKKEDEIGNRLNIVITQANPKDEMNQTVFKTFGSKVNLLGVFGNLTSDIQQAEYYGRWNIFDKNKAFNDILDKINE